MEVAECVDFVPNFEDGNVNIFDVWSKYTKNKIKKEVLRQLNDTSSSVQLPVQNQCLNDLKQQEISSRIVNKEITLNIHKNVLNVDQATDLRIENELRVEPVCPSSGQDEPQGSNLEVAPTLRPRDFIFDVVETEPGSTDFEKLLGSEGFLKLTDFKINRSPADILLMVLKYSVTNCLSLSAICKLLKLINNLLDKDVLPDSAYFVNKYFNPSSHVEYHGTCPNDNCQAYLGKIEAFNKNMECSICKENVKLSKNSYKSFFVLIDPSETIQNIINRYGDYYDDIVSNKNRSNELFEDIVDGKVHKKFVSFLPDKQKHSYASCLMNIDGATPNLSSTVSLWPIHISINEILVTARFRNIITVGLWFDKKKPNMLIYLKPFVEMFNNSLSKIGVDCIIKNKPRNIKIYCIGCMADSPARAPVQGLKQYNGLFSCNWCLIPRVQLDTCRFSHIEFQNYPSRNKSSMVEDMIKFAETGKSVNGVNNVSALINLLYFDIVDDFGVDYLHAALLGLGGQITELILKTLTAQDLKLIDECLLKMKIPYQLARVTRSLTERKLWKAKEWEAWILFYSIPILNQILPKPLLDYWALFSRGLFILLKTSIQESEIIDAYALLFEFAVRTEAYFSIYEASFNLHIVEEHLAKHVLNWGPLFGGSCYPFESANRYLLRSLKTAVGANLQILRYLNLTRSVIGLEKLVLPGASEVFLMQYEDIFNKRQDDSSSVGKKHYFHYTELTKEEEARISTYIQTNNQTAILLEPLFSFLRLLQEDYLYCSSIYRSEKMDSSVAKLGNGNYIRINKFAVSNDKKCEYVLSNSVQLQENGIINEYIPLKKMLIIEEHLTVVSVNELLNVCIIIKVREELYICELPNPYSLYA